MLLQEVEAEYACAIAATHAAVQAAVNFEFHVLPSPSTRRFNNLTINFGRCEWQRLTSVDMHVDPGVRTLLTLKNCVAWQTGVFRSLRATHAAGCAQCDVRHQNVLLFDDLYQLTDYNNAVLLGAEFILRAGGQYDQRGASLASCAVNDIVSWTLELDYEMYRHGLSCMQFFNILSSWYIIKEY